MAALLGSVLLAIGALSERLAIGSFTTDHPLSEAATTWTWTAVTGTTLVGLALLLVGLVGLYAGQAEAVGIVGLVGFLVLFVSVALAFGITWFEVFVLPDVAAAAPEWVDSPNGGWTLFGFELGRSLVVPGWLLFGLATLRAGIYPRAAAITLLIGAVPLPALFGFVGLVDDIIRRVAVAWLGFALFTGRVASREDPVPSSNLIRWGGLAALLAGAAWALASLIGIIAWGTLGEGVAIVLTDPEEAFGTPSFYLAKAVSAVALIGTLGGLVGLHTRQETSYGWLGLAGFFLAFVGTALVMVGTATAIGSGRQVITTMSALGLLGMFIGLVLLGVATLRAKIGRAHV